MPITLDSCSCRLTLPQIIYCVAHLYCSPDVKRTRCIDAILDFGLNIPINAVNLPSLIWVTTSSSTCETRLFQPVDGNTPLTAKFGIFDRHILHPSVGDLATFLNSKRKWMHPQTLAMYCFYSSSISKIIINTIYKAQRW